MRRYVRAAWAAALSIPLSAGFAASAYAVPAAAAGPARQPAIVVWPGHSIQAAVNRAHRGDTILIKPGIYHQNVLIRTNGITLRGSGDSRHGTVLEPPRHLRRNFCTEAFGPTGVCVLARKLNPQLGKVLRSVRGVTVTRLLVTGFRGNGVFGFGTSGLTVTHVTAIGDGAYGISRFQSSRTLFEHDTAIGNGEAGFYIGDSPHADTIVRDDHALRNQFGIFIRHARQVVVSQNLLAGNCLGIFVLDDGQRGGAGTAAIQGNTVLRNNKFCPKRGESPVPFQGGGILLLGATFTGVAHNLVFGNRGRELASGGIVVASARKLSHGSDPRDDVILRNTLRSNAPADLIWDGTGSAIDFVANACTTSIPAGLCR
jgi:Right handed beta helix region